MTGVGYNAKTLTDNNIAEPTKIADLWTIPADKVTFLDRGARHVRARRCSSWASTPTGRR